jgi:hypothetical protein
MSGITARDYGRDAVNKRGDRGSSNGTVAPRHGFEPRFAAPKADGLPLDDRGRGGNPHHSEYSVPSSAVLSEPLRTSKMPGSVWLTLVSASSMMIFQVLFEPVMGSTGSWRR